jgi:hypothetical protein
MKKVIWWICAVIALIGGIQKTNVPMKSQNLDSAYKTAQPFCDDQPIPMHTHIRTGGGLAITGASVTLTLVGTSTPAYSGSTDSNGDCNFSAVNQGNYHYKVSATGYTDKTADLGLHVETTRTDTLLIP